MDKGPDSVQGLRRKRRRYQRQHQTLFLGRNQRRHSQQRHMQSVVAQTIAPLMVRLFISVVYSTQPMGYHVVTTRVSTRK
ncbi:hypothetical protein DPMN_052407 [Dreissena polymorpha]|uniref:Uncharacterized protein n=1 Tax=Dreissena polymorpha TaxID=45954 RepID=A0A9D4CJM7_DREPO|nr:hypothetical protein DPMN_052407 [Dreissena polymorpha]